MPDPIEIKNLAVSAVRLWRGNENSLELIGDSANYVFGFLKSGKKYYLRLTSAGQRTKNQIEAELDFINHLEQGGVNVAGPVPSVSEKLIEEINFAEDPLLACVFSEAKGERFNYHSVNKNKEHFRLRGRTLGQIHSLSQKYVPPGNSGRFVWNEDQLLLEMENFLPATETVVWREFLRLKDLLEHYPRTGATFGLIHGDFGETNYRFQKDKLNVFDFDDCSNHWFLYDLAVSIYPHGWRTEGLQLLDWLLEGYAEKMSLEVKLSDLTMFCQWRLIYMFLVYARKWGFEDLTPRQSEWFARKRENIARGYSWPK